MATVERLRIMEGRLSLAAGGLAIAASLLGIWSRTPLPRPLPLPPATGRAATDVERGEDPRFADVPTPEEARARAFEDRVSALVACLGLDSVPAGVGRAIIYPFAGDLPVTTLEQGPPWHILVLPDGTVEPTDRLRRGLAAVPPGMPRSARRALHVAVPRAEDLSAGRRRALRALATALARRFSAAERPVLLADEVPDSGFAVPSSLDRAAFTKGRGR